MQNTQTGRKRGRLWSRFAKWREFHSQHSLVVVEACIAIGPWMYSWILRNGRVWPKDLKLLVRISAWRQTRLGPLTLHRYYVRREHTTIKRDVLSNMVNSPDHTPSNNSNT